jgi:hypothetical protein
VVAQKAAVALATEMATQAILAMAAAILAARGRGQAMAEEITAKVEVQAMAVMAAAAMGVRLTSICNKQTGETLVTLAEGHYRLGGPFGRRCAGPT